MIIHKMKLITKYFDCIKNGTKRIELRLNDEKRKDIKIGDIIIFEELKDNPRHLKTKVIDLYYEDNFIDLIDKYENIILKTIEKMLKSRYKNGKEKHEIKETSDEQTQYIDKKPWQPQCVVLYCICKIVFFFSPNLI